MNLFPLLQDLPFLSACYVGRVPGVQLPADRQEALRAQIPFFKKTVREILPEARAFFCAQEVHGTEIAILSGSEPQQDLTRIFYPSLLRKPGRPMDAALDSNFDRDSMYSYSPDQNPSSALLHQPSQPPRHESDEISGLIPNVDGMITNEPGMVLGITFADCAPVWIIDPQRKAVALVHSGKRGTEAGIVPKAIRLLQTKFASQPKDLIVTIGPCIRPPCYEVDFAKIIREQAAQSGAGEIRDEEICTACDLEKYYSYRREKGKTGHMLGLVMLQAEGMATKNTKKSKKEQNFNS